MALPERRGGRQCQQQRQIGRQSHDEIDATVEIGHPYMHMQAAQHVAVADHLQVVHDGVVAHLRRDGLLRPECQRKSADGGKAEAALGRRVSKRAAVMLKMRPRFRHAGARRRRHLDLRLQHFGHHAVAEGLAGENEESLVELAHGPTRFRVEHEVFLFDADRIHARDNGLGLAGFPYIIFATQNGRRAKSPRRPLFR